MVVYALIDPCSNEIRYVGKTVRPLRGRLGQHFHPCRLAESSHKAHWLNNLAKRGLRPRVRILEVCDSENELAKAEIGHIVGLRMAGCNLVNMTDGGDGSSKGHPVSDAVKRAISLKNAGRKHTAEAKLKMSLAKQGKPSPRRGAILSDATRLKISASKRGRKINRHG